MFPPRSAYLHIPFCHRRCFYCDFAIVPLGDKADGENGPGSTSIKSYLDLLHREIDLINESHPLSTVYIGGGTPSLLSSHQINCLLDHLRKKFKFQDGAEITLEVDPASFQEKDLNGFLTAGINRFSLGGQSFDDQILQNLGRRHTNKDLYEACSLLNDVFKKGKISSWSLDLIQNLPGHDLMIWKEQIKQAINISPPHLSIYDLSIEPGTVFAWKQKRGALELPNEDIAIEINRLTSDYLRANGFSRYEVSNYALPGHTSRHNRVYWSGSGWWGFGMGATSAPWGKRYERPRTREKYSRWLDEQEAYGLEPSLISKNSRPFDLDEQLIVGLRRREGVNLELMASTWGWTEGESEIYLKKLELRWQEFLRRGVLEKRNSRFFLTDPDGIEISNQILVEMLIWWDSLPAHAVSQPIL